jgi:hypothetical protein
VASPGDDLSSEYHPFALIVHRVTGNARNRPFLHP